MGIVDHYKPLFFSILQLFPSSMSSRYRIQKIGVSALFPLAKERVLVRGNQRRRECCVVARYRGNSFSLGGLGRARGFVTFRRVIYQLTRGVLQRPLEGHILYFAQIQPRIFTRVPALGYHERRYHEECTCHKTFYYADAFRRAASSGHKGYTQLSHYSLFYLYFPKLVSFVYVHVTQLIA